MLMIEALADGGVKVGLGRDTALLLAAQTVYGAAKLQLETGEHPGRLKDMVTSPGGTAIAGLHTLESGGLRRTLIEELGRAAEVGAEGLPEVTSGRFAGRGGATLLSSSRARDVRDFLRFLLAAAPNTDGGFADLYLRWAQQGAPLP